MKKIISMLIFLTLFTSCTSISKREKIFKYPETKTLKKYYQNWEMDKAQNELLSLREKDPLNKEYISFFSKIEKRKHEKEEFYRILELIVMELAVNRTDSLKKYMKKTVENRLKLDYIKDRDLSAFDIFNSKAKFFKKSSKVIIAFTYLDETFYMNVDFELSKKGWKIDEVKERR